MADVHAQILHVVHMRRAPHADQQLPVRQHAAGITRQQRQQRILARAELHSPTRDPHGAPGHVDLERTRGEVLAGRAARGARVAQRGADARQQLGDAERLLDVVIGAVVERLHLLGIAVPCRQHHHRHGAARAQLLQHQLAIHVGQAEIEQDQRRRPASRQPQPVGRRLRPLDGIAGPLQRRTQETVDLRLVVDHQHARLDHGATFMPDRC